MRLDIKLKKISIHLEAAFNQERIDLLKVSISDEMKVLEIGADDRRIGSQLKELFPKIEYNIFLYRPKY